MKYSVIWERKLWEKIWEILENKQFGSGWINTNVMSWYNSHFELFISKQKSRFRYSIDKTVDCCNNGRVENTYYMYVCSRPCPLFTDKRCENTLLLTCRDTWNWFGIRLFIALDPCTMRKLLYLIDFLLFLPSDVHTFQVLFSSQFYRIESSWYSILFSERSPKR